MNSNYPHLDKLNELIDGLIFDLDGTILDSMNLWTAADESFLSKRGYRVTPEYTNLVKSVSIEEAADYTRIHYAPDMTNQQIMDEWNGFVADGYKNKVQLKPGAYDYIKKARDMGYRIACATALTRPNAEAVLGRCGVTKLIDVLLTLDDVAGIRDKREPDIYLLAASKLGCKPSRTLVFEDVPLAIQGARKGAFNICAVYDAVGCGNDEVWNNMCTNADYSITTW